MPVRSSSSWLLEWPDTQKVLAAVVRWAEEQAAAHPELLAVGVFGSYGRGEGAVGSDLDLLLLVGTSPLPPWERGQFAFEKLPLACDPLVYTPQELAALFAKNTRFARTLARELRWLWRGARFQEFRA